ncbi:MAG TPA: hypothetical protein VE078_20430, partial [Thermoanaerobaculia bacterium]|nr:hypothetical protein [Thermoanaerobaculia bacterium]
QIPGTNGFYEQWSYCRGGDWFSFGGGGIDSLSASGGPCAEVTPEEGPPVDGMFYAEVEQTACCSQPIEVSGVGSSFTGPFDLTTADAGSTTPGPTCTCSVSTPPACILKGQQHTFTAQGAPTGGSYQWRVVQGSDRVSINSGANSYSMTLEGTNTSEAADDVQLEMVYTNGTDSCSQLVDLSIVDIAPLEFSASGQADDNNAVRNQPEYGLPKLGPVTPGNPPGTTGFHKNMQIKAEIFPCDPNLRCKFDFQRVKRGVGVYLDGNGNVTRTGFGHCPNGGCPDHNPTGTGDSDVKVDPYPGCSIYVVDSPGMIVGNTNGSCQGFNGMTIVSCFNFDEWMQVDKRQDASSFLKWHAATRIRCNGTNWVLDNGGAGNRIGPGWSPIDCAPGTAYSVTPPLAAEAPAEATEKQRLQQVLEDVDR